MPSTVDPGRIQRRLRPPPREAVPTVKIPSRRTQTRKDVEGLAFVLRDIRLKGVTVYSPETIAALWKPLLGKRIRVRDLYAVANRIVARYKTDGYALVSVTITDQDFERGFVELNVIEGYVSDVLIQGDTGSTLSLAVLRGYARRIAADRPLRQATLERYLLLANQLPGITVGSRYARSSTPGAARLILTVKHEPFNLVAGIDNHGTDTVGPIQFQIGAAQNGLLLFGDQTRFQYAFTTQFNELHFFDLSHQTPIGYDGLRLSFNAFYLKTRPELLDLRGEAVGGQLALAYPIVRSLKDNLDVFVAGSLLNSTADLVSRRLVDDRLRVLRFGVAASRVDGWKGKTAGTLILSQGLDILGATGNSTPNGKPDFTKLTFGVERNQVLFPSTVLRLRATGQYAFTSLLSAERFGIGGTRLGRAFDPSSSTGDHGVGLVGELLYSPPWLRFGEIVKRSVVYGFVDWARVWNRLETERPPYQSAMSAGFGFRVSISKYVTAGVEAAFPILQTGTDDKERGVRVLFTFKARYGG